MATYTGSLQDGAPVIPIKLVAGLLERARIAPISTLATIDTAYACNFIQEGLATQMGLKSIRKAKITTPTRYAVECDVYSIRLAFPDGYELQLEAAEVPFLVNSERFGCVLGRAFLKHRYLLYSGPENSFTLQHERGQMRPIAMKL